MTNEITIPEPLQKQVGPVAQRFAKERQALFELFADLGTRDLTPMTVALAVEADTRAKTFDEDAAKAFGPMTTVAFQTHRSLTAIRGRVVEPVAPLRALCGRIISYYKLAELKKEQEAQAPAERAEIAEKSQAVLGGVSLTRTWEGEVQDFAAFVDFIAAHHELLFLLLPVQGDLNRYLARMKGKVAIPGVKVIERMIKHNRNSEPS